jgi:hypothetical protein
MSRERMFTVKTCFTACQSMLMIPIIHKTGNSIVDSGTCGGSARHRRDRWPSWLAVSSGCVCETRSGMFALPPMSSRERLSRTPTVRNGVFGGT